VFLAPVLLAERNLYLPSAAVALGAGWALAALHRQRPWAAVAVTAVVVLAGGLRTWTRNPVWADSQAVFGALLEDHPEAGRAWLNHGEVLFAAGDHAAARRAFSVALNLLDSEYAPATQVASRLISMDEPSRRAGEFLLRRAWRERPEYFTAPGWLAILYLNEGRHREGEPAARAAIRVAPDHAEMHRILAAHLSGLGRYREAVAVRERALALRADAPWSWWVWLARDRARLGETLAARAALDSARSRAPEAARADIDRLEAELLGGPPA
jgi:tetratricopeptide (TPR) repeat protein